MDKKPQSALSKGGYVQGVDSKHKRAVVMDLFSRRIVGWSMSENIDSN